MHNSSHYSSHDLFYYILFATMMLVTTLYRWHYVGNRLKMFSNVFNRSLTSSISQQPPKVVTNRFCRQHTSPTSMKPILCCHFCIGLLFVESFIKNVNINGTYCTEFKIEEIIDKLHFNCKDCNSSSNILWHPISHVLFSLFSSLLGIKFTTDFHFSR